MRGIQDIGAEGILLAGGGRAILLQIANPAVGAGVAAHSDFANRPLDRLRGTMTYLYAIGFGTPENVAEVRRRVNRAHGPVRRKADAHGDGYDAFDPGLQLWVAATLYDTALQIYERVYGELDEESAEAFYRQYEVVGTALQVPVGSWPADREAFRRYWRQSVAGLTVTPEARRVAWDLLHPRTAPLWLKAAMPLARLLTAGLLPDELRDAYGLPWSAASARRFERFWRAAAVIYPRLPRRLRHALKNRYLRAL
ncbi:oxygenase MpaB family protein [Compostimonas suwonensis]|uniref:Uncharacterized protein (DUF2236 family) n=1 Tax=Compostimonas suwonensis TaxID=1048394 RepID=A0A2M9BV83_9MICO|nr:oxygenase MpaB family protein [Compostimonas suwonensis]PJJ61868.1 uncharacterized protein (DUF2236 family) [Compostimonas suwonensis]